MPCCVLRIDGANFDVEGFLASSDLAPDVVHRRGERRSANSIHETSGFTVLVSSADGNQFQQQVQGAIAFLRNHHPELARLRSCPGVESVTLDFGSDFPYRTAAGRFYRFPLVLLRECAALGVELELSVYATE
jgi:hypothetical protein